MTTHKSIYSALAAAQSEMSAPVKGSVNPAFRSKYADLADVVNAVAPPLGKHGIAFGHYMSRDEHGLWMTTVLWHGESDTKVECPVPLLIGKQDMHGLKSATTYAKRIGLESVTGVAPEDDDGNAAVRAKPDATAEQKAIAWMRDAQDLKALEYRWQKIVADKPDVANDPGVEAAYRAGKARFNPPFPGDEVKP